MDDTVAQSWDLARATAAERFGMTLRVDANTLGTRQVFTLHSVNISRSGALLKADESNPQLPFQNRTLLELVIYPDHKILFSQIRATAKVVRHASVDGIEKALFGIHLLDVENEVEWEALLQRFEANNSAA